MEGFFTWEMLLTYSGATLATTLLTQLFKEIKPVSHIPKRLLSYIIALLLITGSTIAARGFSLSDTAMGFVNAAVVALASNGAFDAVKEERGTRGE